MKKILFWPGLGKPKNVLSTFREKLNKNYEIVTLKNLRKGKGYCLVYSLLFQAVCDRVGLSCQCVLGDAGGYHSWNRVRVGGSWRYVDTAWYDSGKSKKYLYSKKLWSTHTVQSIIKAWQ